MKKSDSLCIDHDALPGIGQGFRFKIHCNCDPKIVIMLDTIKELQKEIRKCERLTCPVCDDAQITIDLLNKLIEDLK